MVEVSLYGSQSWDMSPSCPRWSSRREPASKLPISVIHEPEILALDAIRGHNSDMLYVGIHISLVSALLLYRSFVGYRIP